MNIRLCVIMGNLQLEEFLKAKPKYRQVRSIKMGKFDLIESIKLKMEIEKDLYFQNQVEIVMEDINLDFQNMINQLAKEIDFELEMIVYEKKSNVEIKEQNIIPENDKGVINKEADTFRLIIEKIDLLMFEKI